MKKFFNKYKVEILAFFIPVIIFGLSCVFCKVWPFGEKFIASYDGSAQYGGFTTYLMNILKGKDSLFYSFKGALGFNFYATAVYYLFNPTNLLSVFFNKDNIMLFYTLIVFLRIGLCGLTMSIYLKNKSKSSVGRLLFSIAYALMAYNVAYYYNFMYFDTVVMLPLVILGLDKLLDGKSPLMYIIFLTISIISNYYIGAMVCIFSLLYFIYKFIVDKKSRTKKIVFTFILSSILCGLMCTFVLLPEFYELIGGKASLYGSDYTVYNEWGMDAFASFYRLSIASYAQGDQINGYPNIYSSILVLVYSVLFFFNSKFSKKEKIATGIFFAFFLLCFSFNLLDYAWEFFQKPVWYPNRYSFIFSFLLIITAFKSFENTKTIKMNSMVFIIAALLLCALVVNAGIYCEIFDKDISKIIFLALSVICIIEYMFTHKVKILPIMLASIFILEVSANTIVTMKQIPRPKNLTDYTKLFNELDDSFEYIESIDPSIDNFYRSDASNWTNINSGGTHDYNGMIYFNSLRNGKMMYFLEHYAGYTMQDQCSVRFSGFNPIYTSLFSFKYISTTEKENYYELLNDDLEYKVYRNNDSLSLGFMMNSNIKNLKLEADKFLLNSFNIMGSSINIKTNQYKTITYDKLVNYFEDTKDNKKYVNYNSKDGGYVLYEGIAEKDYFVFANPIMNKNGKMDIVLNGETFTSVNIKKYSPFVINKGDKYEIKYYLSSLAILASDLNIYLLNVHEYKSWINEMKENELVITDYKKDNNIKGTIDVSSDKTTLFTSIPYDEGWIVFVDGKKADYYLLLDAFIGLDLTPGEHTIEFKYIPKGFILGSIISLLSLGSTVLYLKRRKK